MTEIILYRNEDCMLNYKTKTRYNTWNTLKKPMTNLQVVLPTPPFPPTKTQRSVFWSIIFLTVGSRASKSSSTSAVAMLNVSIHSVEEWDRIVLSAIHSHKGRRKRNFKMADALYQERKESSWRVFAGIYNQDVWNLLLSFRR